MFSYPWRADNGRTISIERDDAGQYHFHDYSEIGAHTRFGKGFLDWIRRIELFHELEAQDR